jgi:hypothetical protein
LEEGPLEEVKSVEVRLAGGRWSAAAKSAGWFLLHHTIKKGT